MSSEVTTDPFRQESHATVFILASSDAYETSGGTSWRIPDAQVQELERKLELSTGRAAALAYLASHRAEDIAIEAEIAALFIEQERP